MDNTKVKETAKEISDKLYTLELMEEKLFVFSKGKKDNCSYTELRVTQSYRTSGTTCEAIETDTNNRIFLSEKTADIIRAMVVIDLNESIKMIKEKIEKLRKDISE